MGIKKGGKAKPLSAKVSIDNSEALRATSQPVAKMQPAPMSVPKTSARAVLGIDCAALFSGPVEAAAEAARGSVSLDSMHLRLGG